MKTMTSLLTRCLPWVFVAVFAMWAVMVFLALRGVWRPDGSWVLLFMLTLMFIAVLSMWAKAQRERFLREAPLPQFLKRKLRETYPHLSGKDCDLVERGLRQFFLACSRSQKQFVAMPSRAVDAMWHEFILHTQAYGQWCKSALGFFLHHTPAEALGKQAQRNDGLRRAWYWACKDEAINPKAPSRLPLLFALDAKLAIANGFHYLPDCSEMKLKDDEASVGVAVHCGTSFSDGSFSGGDGDFGGAGGSDSGGDGGGCGGGGGD
jgi:hypothetical protein